MKSRRVFSFFLFFAVLAGLVFPAGAMETPLSKVLLHVPISLPLG